MAQLHQENPATTAIIAWHNGDEFEFPEGMVRDGWYAITGYPTVWFDGITDVIGGYDPTSYPYYLPVYEERIGTPSNFDISMEITNTESTDYNVEVTYDILEGINNENLATFVVLTETDLESPGSDNQHFVARNVWPDAMGEPIDFSTQSSHTINTVITLEDDYIFENCEVITFIQNMDTKEIYQGLNKKMTDITIGVEESHQAPLEIYPNPATERVNIKSASEIKYLEVFNHVGQLIYDGPSTSKIVNLNTSDYNPGLYMIRITTENGSTTKSLIVK